ncbi:MAG: 4,5-DOPA dioxygenase extradiol [Bacteriovoracaceae bacterium]
MMKRRILIKLMGLGLIIPPLFWKTKNYMNTNQNTKELMPLLFIGHGSPLNAIDNNEFTQILSRLGQKLPRPRAILCISAHWMTRGSWITEMESPKTIHDFYGFPQELFNVQYPAPGSPELAQTIKKEIIDPNIHGDTIEWGLDHGTWSVLKHVYPNADIPILQLSLDMTKDSPYHFKLGEKIRFLREQGVLIVGSGDIVHNLKTMNRDKKAAPHPWAKEFDEWTLEKIKNKDFSPLVHDVMKHPGAAMSIPTWDHYYPLLYVLGASTNNDKLEVIYEGIHHSSISMTTFTLG